MEDIRTFLNTTYKKVNSMSLVVTIMSDNWRNTLFDTNWESWYLLLAYYVFDKWSFPGPHTKYSDKEIGRWFHLQLLYERNHSLPRRFAKKINVLQTFIRNVRLWGMVRI